MEREVVARKVVRATCEIINHNEEEERERRNGERKMG